MSQEPQKTGYERRYDVQSPADIETGVLEAIDYLYPGRVTEVEYAYPEFTSVCPWTGLADFGEVIIRYVPRAKLVELKSLKYYLHSFRNVGILQEHVPGRILDDLVPVLDPLRMEIIAEFGSRGGLTTNAVVRYEAK